MRRSQLMVPGVLLLLASSHGVCAAPAVSRGQTIYVPIYSNVFSAPRKIPFNLAAILSIRNTDQATPIVLQSIDYHDSKGRLIRKYVRKPQQLAPLETTDIYIPEDDVSGGTGASFIVRWSARSEVNAPVVEAVMTGLKSGQGVSFISPGREIREGGR